MEIIVHDLIYSFQLLFVELENTMILKRNNRELLEMFNLLFPIQRFLFPSLSIPHYLSPCFLFTTLFYFSLVPALNIFYFGIEHVTHQLNARHVDLPPDRPFHKITRRHPKDKHFTTCIACRFQRRLPLCHTAPTVNKLLLLEGGASSR
jgi:hypothetical protein